MTKIVISTALRTANGRPLFLIPGICVNGCSTKLLMRVLNLGILSHGMGKLERRSAPLPCPPMKVGLLLQPTSFVVTFSIVYHPLTLPLIGHQRLEEKIMSGLSSTSIASSERGRWRRSDADITARSDGCEK